MAIDWGHSVLGYNVSSGTVSPSLRYTGRLAADTLGTMSQGDNMLVNGTTTNGSNRYGDYAAMSVDPSDDTAALCHRRDVYAEQLADCLQRAGFECYLATQRQRSGGDRAQVRSTTGA